MITIMEAYPEASGLIPLFLDDADPRSAVEQLDANYCDGWHDFTLKDRCTLSNTRHLLKYTDAEGTEEFRLKAAILMRTEMIYIYECDWVVVVNCLDDSWRMARMT